jgi:hypothetical protein
MDWGLLGAIYAIFHACHGIGDYWAQSDWMARNKSKSWGALVSHALVYSLPFTIAGAILVNTANISVYKFLVLPFVVAVPHAWMDRRRFLAWFCKKTKGWDAGDLEGMEKAGASVSTIAQTVYIRGHVSIAMDQKFHYLCLLLTAAWLAYNVPS